jgi:hypothetical protein
MTLSPLARAVVFALVTLSLGSGCGGVTVSPTGTSTATGTVKSGHPTELSFHGTLMDGGTFTGYIIYGSRDIEGRQQLGRYQAIYWDIAVKGGGQTRDAHFTHTNVGRALVETYTAPFPAIGLTFLWPDHDPELQWFTPHFRSVSAYKPDEPPTRDDIGELLPGSMTDGISIYRDGQGGATFVRSVEFDPPTSVPTERP